MKIFWNLLVLVSLISCQDINEVKKPAGLIPEDKMVAVLTDLSILSSAKNYNKRILEETGVQTDKFLFEKYSIDSLQLAQSMEFYAKKYDRLEQIYQEVKINLESKKDILEKQKKEEERIKDSIREAELCADSLKTDLKDRKDKLIDSLLAPPPVRQRIE